MKRQFFSFFTAVTAALALVACGSSVKLSDVPVESRVGGPVGQAGVTPPASPAATAVAPVAIRSADSLAMGPADVGRVIYFDYDSFTIRPEFQSVIEAHARFLGANKSRKIAIEGHTDERGGREYNIALGQKRAEAVRRALALLGVTEGQVEAVSLGKEKPASMAGTEDAFAKNRRAEISYR